ncbi:MAG TPA: hypothetical protein VNO79_17365 [Actinomycetota bacterium]|nr:hypothetical protein [Actinomycetota bacterium]
MSRPRRRALPALALGAVGALLLAALWGGLVRIGWRFPTGGGAVVAHHGILMTLGVLGTLIGLERAAASPWRWPVLGPLASAGGAVALLAGSPTLGLALLLVGGLVVGALLAALLVRQPSLHGAALALGAWLWTAAVAVRWVSGATHRAVPWLAAFLVVTIAAERLELARMRSLSTSARSGFVGAVAVLLGGLVVSLVAFDAGVRIAGVGLVALASWLGAYDVTRRTIRGAGLTRYIALALLLGYAWLGVAGGLWVVAGGVAGGPVRDAMLHALFLGFVMSMVFAHAPVILPAVLGLQIAWAPSAYVPLVLLHASLLGRVLGDLSGATAVVRWMGLLNAVAILLFPLDTARTRLAAGGRPRAGD